MRWRLAAPRVGGVQGARSDTVRREDNDVVEHYLLDVQQRAIDVVSAPLGRTVALAIVAFGLDLAARSSVIGGFDAYGVTARTESQHGYIELRQRQTRSLRSPFGVP